MKLPASISGVRDRIGYLLIECLVYLSVIMVVLGLGFGAFYVCWDHSKALHYATEAIIAALRAGERWRADVRNATGSIAVEAAPDGERLCIPRGRDRIIYSFSAGEVRRQVASSGFSELLLPKVATSQMVKEARGPAAAWRWEVKLTPRRKETRLPLAFTFEAAARPTP
jgi:hypothetical protein